MTREEGVWLWLDRSRGIGPGRARQLVDYFGGEEALWEADTEEIAQTVGRQAAQGLQAGRNGEALNAFVRRCREKGVRIVTPASEHYPALLRDLYDPPCALYCLGDLSLLDGELLTIVGTRRHTQYGLKVTKKLAGDLAAAGVTIVSALTEGLDEAALESALDAGGRAIALLACGPDGSAGAYSEELQRRVAEEGLIVSEYAPGTAGSRASFQARNRLLAGMTRGTLVTEAAEKSGTLLVTELAMEYGREVFTVPGNIDSPASYATNRLMRTSAEIVLEAKDVLNVLGLSALEMGTEKATAVSLNEEEKSVMEHLKREPLSFDQLIIKTGFAAAKLNSLLTMLQLKGIIDQTAGRVYAAKD